ncbi:hypothetical protein ABK040_006897 [Willaertia magna]
MSFKLLPIEIVVFIFDFQIFDISHYEYLLFINKEEEEQRNEEEEYLTTSNFTNTFYQFISSYWNNSDDSVDSFYGYDGDKNKILFKNCKLNRKIVKLLFGYKSEKRETILLLWRNLKVNLLQYNSLQNNNLQNYSLQRYNYLKRLSNCLPIIINLNYLEINNFIDFLFFEKYLNCKKFTNLEKLKVNNSFPVKNFTKKINFLNNYIEMPNLKYLNISGLEIPFIDKNFIENFQKFFNNFKNIKILKWNFTISLQNNHEIQEIKLKSLFFNNFTEIIKNLQLTELFLDGCGITDIGLINILQNLITLKKLSLKFNNKITLDHENYKFLKENNLISLNLSFCNLSYFQGLYFLLMEKLKNLRILKIAGNPNLSLFISTINILINKFNYLDIRKSLCMNEGSLYLNNLNVLKLENIENNSICIKKFCNLNHLQIINFEINLEQLKDLVDNCKFSLKKLKLNKNKITNEGAIYIATQFTNYNLTELDLSYNFIKDTGCVAILQLQSLQKLKLNEIDITNHCFYQLNHLPIHLYHLEMNGCKIGENTACEILFCKNKKQKSRLSHLSINNCYFADLIVDYLNKYYSLRYLDVRDCRLSKEGKNRLILECPFISEILL